jgi:ATP-dependent DNA helicase RecG
MLSADDIDVLAHKGETMDVEFKGEAKRALSDDDLVSAVVCLANGPGGRLFVGIDDDGRITGARPRHGDTIDAVRIEALISNRTRPACAVRAEVIRHPKGLILVVEVRHSNVPVATSNGTYLRRAIGGDGRPSCVPFFAFEATGGHVSADPVTAVVTSATWDDLDPLEIERMRRFVRETGRGDASLLPLSDMDLCKSLGVVDGHTHVAGIRQLGLFLFGREEALRRFVPTHEVAWQVLDGTAVMENDIWRWPLFRIVEEVTARFRARNRSQELVELFRLEVPDYAPEGFREALINALVHRDFAKLGAVHVQWHNDHIRIDNPGGFPEGVRLDNLLVTQPRPRNPALADAFKRAGLVERTGRGVDTIFAGQLRYGRAAPEYGLSNEASVTVLLRGGPANLKLAGFIASEGRNGRAAELADLLVLNRLAHQRSITTDVTAALLQQDETVARGRLNRMVELGWLEPRGERKGRSYLLSAKLYEVLGDAAAFVRAKGFEPQQQVQMVLQFAKKHGQITRAEAADLCRVSLDQASRILARTAKEGKNFRLKGKGRGARYVFVRWRK